MHSIEIFIEAYLIQLSNKNVQKKINVVIFKEKKNIEFLKFTFIF